MQDNNETFSKLNALVVSLSKEKDKRKFLDIGLGIADEVMHILGIPYNQLDKGDDELDKALPNAKFKNQKMEQWFEKHPYLGNARIALYHYNKGKYPIESMFYMLSDSSRKEKIAATTQLFTNWEDSQLTMIPTYKVGIDFFLSPKTKSILLVISKKTNLRVLELSEKLTNTQIEIFNKVKNVALYNGIDVKTGSKIPFEPQRTIHTTLWDAFELREVNKKFYIGIAEHFQLLCQHLWRNPPEGVDSTEIKESAKVFSSRLLGRLLFIWFLRKKGIINKDFAYFVVDSLSATEYYDKVLKKLFFNTLNTPVNERKFGEDLITPYLNGGLFEPHISDWADKKISFPEGWFNTLYNHLNEFNFTTDESSPEYEQIAIDPEMLGRVFENLLASIVSETSKAANKRNQMGAFYTPREIVTFMCKSSLKEFLKRHALSDKDYDGIDKLIDLSDSDFIFQKSTGTSDLWGTRSNVVRAALIDALNDIKILDPACGSGAFPIGMLQLLVKTYDRLNAIYDSKIGKMRPISMTEHNNVYLTKLFIIRNCLFGVDIEPMAAEISRLRAWLSLIIDDKKDVDPLPNLDFNFVCANSLVPLENSQTTSIFFDAEEYDKKYDSLISKYFNAHSRAEKEALRKEFFELLASGDTTFSNDSKLIRRVNQIKSWNPFVPSKAADFFDPKKMFNVDAFDVVIGNPPYIQLQSMKELSRDLYYPLGYETYCATGDMYCMFIERGSKLLKSGGILTYITSNKWMRAGYGEKLRGYLANKTNPLLLIDFGGTKVFDSATVDTDILQVSKEKNQGKTISCEIKNDSGNNDNKECLDNLSDYVQHNFSITSFHTLENWVICEDLDDKIKAKIEKFGKRLGEWNLNIYRGILTGYNDAFIIDQKTKDSLISQNPNCADFIRPILRGRDIKKYNYSYSNLFLLCLFPSKAYNINDFPFVKQYLESFGIHRLEQTGKTYFENGVKIKARKKTTNKWFETQDSIAYWNEFSKQKIIYPCIMRDGPHFMFDTKGNFYTIAPGNIITGDHLEYLLGYLCSKTIYFCLRKFYMGGGIEGELKTNRLLKLPIPIYQANMSCIEIEKIVNLIIVHLDSEQEKNNYESELENLIQNSLGLSKEEKDYINSYNFH